MKGDLNTVVRHANDLILKESHYGLSCIIDEKGRFDEILMKNGITQERINKYCKSGSWLAMNYPMTDYTEKILNHYGWYKSEGV